MHPSGVRDLRDELLKIGTNNTLFIGTHSTHMVDRDNLSRHFSVTKKETLTSVTPIEENPYQEEVIYEALGTTIYEHIKPNTIIFEGTTDKDIFDTFTNKFKTELKPLNYGSISGKSAGKIRTYACHFTHGSSKAFLVFDSDKTGRDEKNNVLKDSGLKKHFKAHNTFEINEIYDTKKEATLEDLYPHEIIMTTLEHLEHTITINPEEPLMAQIKTHNKLKGNKINNKALKIELVQAVIADVNKLKKDDSKGKYATYYEFITNLYAKVKTPPSKD